LLEKQIKRNENASRKPTIKANKNNILEKISEIEKTKIDENIELINKDQQDSPDIKTKMRVNRGFNYLQNLAKNLKIIKSKKDKDKLNYDEMTKILLDKSCS